MSSAEKYLWAAYLVVFGTILLYLVLIGLKVGRIERELAELVEMTSGREEARG